MTSPTSPPPHQDPHLRESEDVSILEYVTTAVASLDRRFDSLHQDLKDAIAQRFIDSALLYDERYRTQKEGVREALVAQDKLVAAALVAQDKAITKAEVASEKRFDAVNEFRATLSDQTKTFMPRAETDSRLASMSEKIDALKETMLTTAGRDQGMNWPTALRELNDKVDSLKASRSESTGKSMGVSQLWGVLLGAVGLISILVSLYLNLSRKQ